MLHRPGPALRAAAGAAALALSAACGASLPTSSEAAAAETADAVCSLLRAWNDDLGEVVNATSQAITDDDDPSTANAVLADGFERLVDVAEDRRAQLDTLDLPASRDREALLDELRAGADESIAILDDELDDIAELEPITVDDQAGALGGAFVTVEGALAVIEPRAGAYSPELRAAFAGDEGCRHVVQPA